MSRRKVEDRCTKYLGVYYGRIHIVPELDQEVIAEEETVRKAIEVYLKGNRLAPDRRVQQPAQ